MLRLIGALTAFVIAAEVAFAEAAELPPAVEVELAEEWRIPGEIDGEPLGRIVSVLVGNSGQVFLLDGKLSRVFVVGEADGRLVEAFGKEGEGPGDLRRPQYVFGAGDDEIGVVGLMPPAVQTLTYVGDYLDRRELVPQDDIMFATLGRVEPTPGGYVVSGSATNANMDQMLFVGYATSELDMTSRFVGRRVAEQGRLRMHDLMFDRPRWVLVGGEVFVTSEYSKYRIEVYTADGSEQRTLAVDYPQEKRNQEDVSFLENYIAKAGKTGAAVDTFVDPNHRTIEELYGLPDGTLLVLSGRGARTEIDGSLGDFDVVDPSSGEISRRLRLVGAGHPLFDNYVFSKDKLFVITGMRPPVYHPSRDDVRETPHMSVICYNIENLQSAQ